MKRTFVPPPIIRYAASAIVLAACIGFFVAACRPQPSTHAGTIVSDTVPAITVSGTVSYKQRMALPKGAVVRVMVQDVSLQDAPAKFMGEEVITTDGAQQVPLTYAIRVPEKSIDARARYSVSARIEIGGQLRFISTSQYPVITMASPTQVAITVDPVPL